MDRVKTAIHSITVVCIILSLSVVDAKAQNTVSDISVDSVTTTFVPVFGFSSDIGVIGGGAFSRFDYRSPVPPFRSRWQIFGAASTRGFITLESLYEKTRSFNTNIRTTYKLELERLKFDSYFGIGNDTEFNEEQWEDDFYFFESLSIEIGFEGRKPIYRQEQTRFDWLFGFDITYQIPYVRDEITRFGIDRPAGETGGWVNALLTGLIWENRNNEFDPTRGNRAELSFRWAPELLLSDFNMAAFRLDFRQYFRVLDFVTVAGRVRARHARGDIPYWEFSALGDDNTLRGYPLNRFLGNSSVEYNLELRKWFFNFPNAGIKLGGQLFTDVGRVFTERDSFDDLFRDYKQTLGVGGAISLFNPDFILRGDVGFSEDLTQVYISAGYMF